MKTPHLTTCRNLFLAQLLLYVLFLSFYSCSKSEDSNSSADVEVNAQTFGGSLNDNAKAVIATTDGGFAVLGHTQSDDGDVLNKQNTSFDYWLLKFDATGSLQWNETYGGSGDDRGNSLIQAQDGGFVILGYSQSLDGDVSENAGAQDHWIAKTDASGGLIWQKSFGFSGRDEGISLIATSDSGFLIVGLLDVTASGGAGALSARRHAGGDYWAIKINQEGHLEWSNFFGGTFTDTAFDAVEASNGEFIIVGSSDSIDVDISDNKGSYDFWIVKISATGQIIWEKNFGGSEVDEAHEIIVTSDGNYLIVGETRSSDGDIAFNHGGADVWVLRMSEDGDMLSENTYGGTSFEAGRAVTKSINGGYLIAGSSRSSDGNLELNQGQNDAWILKINDGGELLWQRSVGGSEIDFAHGITQLADGRIIAVGESASSDKEVTENKGFTDMMIIELKE